MEKPDIEFVQGPFISTRDSLEEAEVAPAASRLTKEKRRSAELPSSFDTSSRSYRAPPNDHGSSYRFPTYSIFSDSSTYSCCIYPAGLQGAPPITNDIHDRPQGPQRFLLIDLSNIFIFIWFSSDPRSQGHFINRRLLSSFPILFFFLLLFSIVFSHLQAFDLSIGCEFLNSLVLSTIERSSCERRAPPQFFRPPRRTADIVVHISARGVSTTLFPFRSLPPILSVIVRRSFNPEAS